MTIKQMLERRGQISHRMQEIVNTAEAAERDLSAEENAEFDKLHAEDMQLKAKIDRQQKLDAINADLDEPRWGQYRDDFHGAPGRTVPGDDDDDAPGAAPRDHQVAARTWLLHQMGHDVSDEMVAACRRVGVNPRGQHLRLQTGNTGHLRRLQSQFLARHPSMRAQIVPQPYADLGTGGASGGGIISEDFMQRIDLALLYFGPMLQTSEVIVTQTGNDLKWPTGDDTSNVGEQLDEEDSIGTSEDPDISSRTLAAFKFSSKPVLVSVELIEDEEIGLPALLGDMLGERLGRILNARTTTGGGSTTVDGLVTRAQVGKTAAAVNAITPEELIDLYHSVDVAYRSAPGVGWMMHDAVVAVVRKLKQDGQFVWRPGLADGVPDRLLGAPVNVNNDMAGTLEADAKPIAFGDLRRYKIRLVRGVRMRRLVERYADTDQEAFIGFLRADGDLLTPSAIKTLQMDDG